MVMEVYEIKEGVRLLRLTGFMALLVLYDAVFATLTTDRMTFNAVLAFSLAWDTEKTAA
jgi:hypothetical protein